MSATAQDLQLQMQQLARRRAIADAMMQNVMSPQQIPAGGRLTPLAMLANVGTAAFAGRQGKKLDKQYADIAKQMSSARMDELRKAMGGAIQVPQDMSAPSMQGSGATTNFETGEMTGMPPVLGMPSSSSSLRGPMQRTPQDLGAAARGPDLVAAQNAIDLGANPALVLQAMKPPRENDPNSVREFEYAKQNGFTGSFQDWVKMGGQTSRPSSVQEWEFYNSLSPEQKPLYLEMKRNPNMVVKDIGQVPSVVASRVSGTSVTPLSTLPKEATGAGAIKQAEAAGGALGKAEGEIAGGIQTKGANAVGTQNLLDIADPLIDVATGSTAGAAADKVAGFFGKATSGAEAIAQLKVLEASLIQNMPRLEGPQSDADKVLYQEAAAKIGDPRVPAPIKKAALKTVRQIQQKYIERAQTAPGAAPGASAPPQIQAPSFASEAEADAAARAGTLKPGTKVVIGGVSGTWQ